jgi:micrococcal nuclease
MTNGTTIQAKVSRVVDGDTIRVFLPGETEDESLRILALDTEESHPGGGKPVTPWGKEAKKKAQQFFSPDDTVLLEYPGNENADICLKRYRGNYGRLLVFVYKDGTDFQEEMIREGYSPYFVKYGNASFASHHERYIQAERIAQQKFLGVWNQIEVNGSEIRNYAVLKTWWTLRAQIIDEYRKIKPNYPDLLNTRLDYDTLATRAQSGDTLTVFTELSSYKLVSQQSAIVKIGSVKQPFTLFIPDAISDEGQKILNLLEYRYISKGDGYPRRSYAYLTGQLSLYGGKPQIVVTNAEQIQDNMTS